MKAICVDDEPLAVEYTLGQCALLPEIEEAKGYTDALSALEWLRDHSADIAILDINMPEIDGITLAARIKQAHPETAILFLTAYKEYAYDAYSVHPSGYLLKPVSQERLAEEIRYACKKTRRASHAHVFIRTFGTFDVLVDGRPIGFRLSKAKEILAYLVDKQGSGVTRAELFAAVWEDRPYDRSMQKQLDTYIRSLRETLREYGISEIMEMDKGVLRVNTDTFACDAYLFYSGDSSAVNAYRGEYMSSYSWASMTEALMFWRKANKN
ncbi:MAG: response regulator [Clostridia bacterium]|nr:response regulator [Clostridia bacterium]